MKIAWLELAVIRSGVRSPSVPPLRINRLGPLAMVALAVCVPVLFQRSRGVMLRANVQSGSFSGVGLRSPNTYSSGTGGDYDQRTQAAT